MVRYAQKPESEKEKKVTFVSKEPIVCPVCEASFNREELFSGRVNAGDLTDELHRTYIPTHNYGEVYPLVYELTVCPSCWYSAYKADFLGIPTKLGGVLKDGTAARVEAAQRVFGGADFSSPRGLMEGAASYYLAMLCYEHLPKEFSPAIKQGLSRPARRLALRLPRREASRRELRLRGAGLLRQGPLPLPPRHRARAEGQGAAHDGEVARARHRQELRLRGRPLPLRHPRAQIRPARGRGQAHRDPGRRQADHREDVRHRPQEQVQARPPRRQGSRPLRRARRRSSTRTKKRMRSRAGNIRLVLSYDGTDFGGWQRQGNARSVQGELEAALERMHGHPVPTLGAGRTDSGVHAMGQVANFYTDIAGIEAERFLPALNKLLPRDVRVLSAAEADFDFHSRYDARLRRYRYFVLCSPSPDPMRLRYCHHLRRRPDLESLNAAAALVLGETDFTAFSSAKDESANRSRFVSRVGLPLGGRGPRLPDRGQRLSLAHGALPRRLDAAITRPRPRARRRRAAERMERPCARGTAPLAGPTAPARGLFLWNVEYYGSPTRPGRGDYWAAWKGIDALVGSFNRSLPAEVSAESLSRHPLTDRFAAALAGADAHDLGEVVDEYLAVADLARPAPPTGWPVSSARRRPR